MAKYIKANPKVVQYLRLENDRNRVKDGNYLLWQADMLAFGRLTQLPEILRQIGGIALLAHEARQEQDGTMIRELPVATDERFVVGTPSAAQPSEETGTGTADKAEGSGETASGGTESSTPEESGSTNEEPEETEGV